jgi:hypothetical protein
MSSSDIGMPWSIRGASRWGHWGAQVLIAAIVATISLVLRPLPADSSAALVVPVALFTLVIASWVLMRQHDRRLCEHCVASMPLDAGATAVRYRRRFALTHFSTKRLWVAAYVVILVGSNVVLLNTALLPAPVNRWVWAAVQLTMVYVVLSYSTHRKLQPWCPQCRDGGGTRRTSDAPEPAPTGSRTT